MAGEVKPCRGLFHRHELLRRELGNVGQDERGLLRGLRAHAEKVDLPLHVRAVALGDAVHHLFVDSDELRALRARRIERACADQVLDRTLIDLHAVHAAAEILKVDERAVELTLLHHAQNEPAADVLDGDEAEADALGLDREAVGGVVDVRRQELDAALAALVEVLAHLVGRVEHAREQCRHVFFRIVALEVCRLIRDDRIGRGVRLVERVVREGVNFLVNFLRGLLVDAVCHAAGDIARGIAVQKRLALALDVLDLLLAHRAAQHVCLAERVARELLEDLDDLLLIHDAAIGDRQDRLKLRNEVCDLFRVVFAGNEFRNGLHRPRTVERDQSRDVFDVLRLQADAHARHAARFELEDARRPPRGQHFVGRGVIFRNTGKSKVFILFTDRLDCVIQNREVAQAKEVHFEQAELFERRHHVLADDRVVVARERDIVDDRSLRDNHAGGVRRGVARHAFKGACRVDELFHLLVALVLFAQLARDAQRVVERDVRPCGDELGDDVAVGIAHIECASHIANDAARGHRAEGHDLRHVIVAVLAAHILHDLAAARIAEVHVDIRHGHALGIQKALEKEAVFHRLDVCDRQAVRNDTARRAAAARTDGDTDALGVAHKVGDDQKVVDKAHALDHVLLVFELRALLVRPFAIALGEAVGAELFKVCERGVALRHLEFRQMVLAERKLQIAALGDLAGVLDRLGIVGKQRRHLLGRTKIEALRLIAHAVFVVHGLARLDAEQHVVRVGIFFSKIVRVICHDEREPRLLVQAQDALVDDGLIADAVVLQFEVEVLGAKDFR